MSYKKIASAITSVVNPTILVLPDNPTDKDDLLADSDAVLALSLSTINTNLEFMDIRRTWSLAWKYDKETDTTAVFDGADSASDIKAWIELRHQVTEAFKNRDPSYFDLLDQMKEQGLDFDGAWNVKIGSYTVEAIPNASDRVLLRINFAAGQLIAPSEGGLDLDSFELGGCSYAFETFLGKLPVQVGDGSMIPEAEKAAEQVWVEADLDSSAFSIESIFMDLQKSDVAVFSKKRSVIPVGSEFAMTSSIAKMFNTVMAEDEKRKFLLGYTVQQTKLKEVGKAKFQPTSLSYSVTYVPPDEDDDSKPNPESSFNFHMQIDGGSPELYKKLPVPLLSGYMTDEQSEVDGVFALRYSIFEENVIDKLVRNALNKAVDELDFKNRNLVERIPGVQWDITASKNYKDSKVEFNLRSGLFGDGKRIVRQTLHISAFVVTERDVLRIRFRVRIQHTQKYEAFRLAGLADDVVDWLNPFDKPKKFKTLETVLTVSSSTAKGQHGEYYVDIKPGEVGKLTAEEVKVDKEMNIQYSNHHLSRYFYDAVDVSEGIFSGKSFKDFARDVARDAIRKASVSAKIEDALGAQLKEAFDFTRSVDALSVVMPLGNLYTFKGLNLRQNFASKVLEATVGYAPIEAADN